MITIFCEEVKLLYFQVTTLQTKHNNYYRVCTQTISYLYYTCAVTHL